MVVSVDELDCLDLLVWLRTGANVASRLFISQPKVSRSVQKVSGLFGVSLSKGNGEWEVQGDQTLLNLERKVHQEYRWRMGRPLRIEAQYYSGPVFCDPPPEGWVAGNFDYLEIHTPLQHLRNGVIDAWIGCYPDVPDDEDKDLKSFHVTRFPLHLVVSEKHPLLRLGHQITLDSLRGYPSLALPDGAFPCLQQVLQELGLWNSPTDLLRYATDKWEGKIESGLAIGYATVFTLNLFKSPQVVLPLEIPVDVGDSLVVRRDYLSHPRLLQLLEQLKNKASVLVKQYPEVTIP